MQIILYRNLIKMSLTKSHILKLKETEQISGREISTLWQNIQAAVSYKLVSYMWVLTVVGLRKIPSTDLYNTTNWAL